MFKDFAFKRFELYEVWLAALRAVFVVFGFFRRKHRLDKPCPGDGGFFCFFSFQKCEIWCVVRRLGDGAVQKECKLIRGIPFSFNPFPESARIIWKNSHFALKTSLDMLGSTDGSY